MNTTNFNSLLFLLFLFFANNTLFSQSQKIEIKFKKTSPITSSALSPDNQFLVQVKENGSILLFDLLEGEVTKVLKGNKTKINCVGITKRNQIIGGGSDGFIYIWGIDNDKPIKIKAHEKEINIIKIFNQQILTGSNDNLIKLWDDDSFELSTTYSGHSSSITALSINQKKSHFISGSMNGEIFYWNFSNTNPMVISKKDNSRIELVSFSPDKKFVFSVDNNNYINQWHIKSKSLANSKLFQDEISSVISNNHGLIISHSNKITKWIFKTNKIKKSFNVSSSIKEFCPTPYLNYFIGSDKLGITRLFEQGNLNEIACLNGWSKNKSFIVVSKESYDGNKDGFRLTRIKVDNSWEKVSNQNKLTKEKKLLKNLLFGITFLKKERKQKIVLSKYERIKLTQIYVRDYKKKQESNKDTIEFCPLNIGDLITITPTTNTFKIFNNITIYDGSIKSVKEEFADVLISHSGIHSYQSVIAHQNINVNPSGCLTAITSVNTVSPYPFNLFEYGYVELTPGKGREKPSIKVKRDLVISSDIKPKNRALIFSVSDYKDKNLGNLPNTVLNGEELKKRLEKNFDFEVSFFKNPTKLEVLKTIDSIAKLNYDSLDQLLVFFSGHGSQIEEGYEKKIGLLHASDSNINDNYSSIEHSALARKLDLLKCRHILFVIDACFSARFGDSIENTNSQNAYSGCKYCNERTEGDLYKEELKDKSRLYLAAGEKETFTGDNTKTNPFTTAFLKSLNVENWETNKKAIDFLEIRIAVRKEELNPIPKGGSFIETVGSGGNFIFYKKKMKIK